MALLDNVDKIAFASSIPSDLILGTYTGSFVAAAPATIPFTKTSTNFTINTGISEKTFFLGIFSTDGGTTWVDFNSNIPNISNPSVVALQTQMLYGRSKPNTLVLTADNWSYYNGSTTTSAAYTFQFKVVVYARPDQGNVTPQPVTQSLNFSTVYNYQKIFRDSVFPFTLPIGTSTLTLTHNLGYIPKIRGYIDNFSYATDTAALYDFGYFSSQTLFDLYIDTTSVKYFFDNSSGVGNMTGTIYTRIYFDS